MRRGQLSLSVVEAGVGVLVVFAVTVTFVVGVQPPDADARQLDVYADDAATLLANEPAGGPGLDYAVATEAAFRTHSDALGDRVEALLPPNVLYRVETPRGAVGYPRPGGVQAGAATVTTPNGTVTVWTWYA